ncbi:SulP family inorganic anion transporter [Blastopirellula sp. JC732]|uniref:SulP family inorganic anion transporter n=1 Tax=Blastopirellula sediminis TaxID=2894196 RepID=A0A9X1MS45_9BACT|nr:SulP family inorganic anion transporter [Blastopirellula sediminis]MCC9604850.1 SulP family inorganic anion transporter [Blastopirellula sediminis]MCC9631851.1 SulP family inorganic anion transporter [Blastopirellula sediminis]
MLHFFQSQQQNFKNDLLSGLTVALALVPEAVAFAFVAGVSPVIGLYSAFFLGLLTAIFGGRPGMISGATGAMAVIVVGLVAGHGIEYMFPAVILCGLLQITFGLTRLGVLIRMVPHSVMLGFVNGLAIVIGMAQFGSFQTISDSGVLTYLSGPPLWIMLSLTAVTMAIIWLLPKFTRAIPSSLAALLVLTITSVVLNQTLDKSLAAPNQDHVVMTVGDMLLTNAKSKAADVARGDVATDGHGSSAAPDAELTPEVAAAMGSVTPETTGISGGLPRLFFLDYILPPLTWETLLIIFPYSVVLAAVGLIESLMTLTLVDEITETQGSGNRECVGQGIANVVCGLFGGMGGCAMIGQSLINVNSGGRGRLSGITAAVCLLAFVLFLAPWIEMIPMAALVGVMFMVVIGTFEWASLRMFGKVPASDYFVMLVVAGYTAVMHDLATAVILGVIVSALVFAWRHSQNIGADIKINELGAKVYQLHGPLFFASVTSFKKLFDPEKDPDDVVIDFYYTRVYDQSGMEAITGLTEKYEQLGKRLVLTHLSPECRQMLDRAHTIVTVNHAEEPQFHVTTERILKVEKTKAEATA